MNRGKKFFTSVGLAVLLLFGLTVPAHAITTLTSSPLDVVDGQFIFCAIVNVGPHPITVTVQVIDSLGGVRATGNVVIPPGQSDRTGISDGPLTGYCKFTGNFNRGFVRANAQIVEGPPFTTIVAVPAQAVGE